MKIFALPAVFSCLMAICPGIAGAQTTDTVAAKVGIYQDVRINVLLDKHIELNTVAKTMDGFRIQVFFDSGNNSKTKAQAVLDEFIAKYPKCGAYLTFKSPNYKVRVGDFRTRLDAQRFLNEIISDYPNAFIIGDQINLPSVE